MPKSIRFGLALKINSCIFVASLPGLTPALRSLIKLRFSTTALVCTTRLSIKICSNTSTLSGNRTITRPTLLRHSRESTNLNWILDKRFGYVLRSPSFSIGSDPFEINISTVMLRQIKMDRSLWPFRDNALTGARQDWTFRCGERPLSSISPI